jgi:hypothetical protein
MESNCTDINLYDQDLWPVFAITTYGTSGVLVVVQSLMAYQIFKKGHNFLGVLVVSVMLANLIRILDVAVWKEDPRWLAVTSTLQQGFMNTASCIMASIYIMVYVGNRYIMNRKEIPAESKAWQWVVFIILLLFNWVVPILCGCELFTNDIDLFDLVVSDS